MCADYVSRSDSSATASSTRCSYRGLGLPDVESRAAQLVEVGLWEPVTEPSGQIAGYIVTGWLERNDTAEEIAKRRQQKADAGAKGGVQSGKSRRAEAGAT